MGMDLRGFMADQNIRLECLQVLYVFGKDRATVLAGKTFTPEIPFSAMRKERLAVGVRRRLWRVPDLATEDATETRHLNTVNLDHTTMKSTFRAGKQVVVILHLIGVMVAVDKPDVRQIEDGCKCLLKWVGETQISQQDHRRRSSMQDTLNDVVKRPMRVTAEQDHDVSIGYLTTG